MNVSILNNNGKVYINCEYIKGYAFNNVMSREKSALLPVFCANFGQLRDCSVYFRRFECLLPHINIA